MDKSRQIPDTDWSVMHHRGARQSILLVDKRHAIPLAGLVTWQMQGTSLVILTNRQAQIELLNFLFDPIMTDARHEFEFSFVDQRSGLPTDGAVVRSHKV